jgi:hypothetical protein
MIRETEPDEYGLHYLKYSARQCTIHKKKKDEIVTEKNLALAFLLEN